MTIAADTGARVPGDGLAERYRWHARGTGVLFLLLWGALLVLDVIHSQVWQSPVALFVLHGVDTLFVLGALMAGWHLASAHTLERQRALAALRRLQQQLEQVSQQKALLDQSFDVLMHLCTGKEVPLSADHP